MGLQTSGRITLSQLQNEFGGSNPIRLSEYYRGGSLVPSWSGTSSIPSSSAIRLSNFYGARPYPTQAVYKVTGSFTANIGNPGVPKFATLVCSRFTRNPAGSIPTPSTSVSGCSTIVNRANGISNDGHAAGIWTANLGTATSVGFNLFSETSVIWMVVVHYNVTSLTTINATYTDSASTLNLATSSQGFALAAAVNNFGGVGPSITNCDDNFSNNDNVTVGLDTATTGATTGYAGSGTRIFLNVAASFGY